jgi:membrane protein
MVFGQTAARGAVVNELSGLTGRNSAVALQDVLKGAAYYGSSALGVGGVTLAITATGLFVELQIALNVIWRAPPPQSVTVSIIRGRLLSLGLLATLGFLLTVSLLVSTALQAVATWFSSRWQGIIPYWPRPMQ